MKYILFLLLSTQAHAFSKKPPKPEVPQEVVDEVVEVLRPKPIAIKYIARWDGKHSDAGKWTAHTVEQIKRQELHLSTPTDIASYCGSYKGNEIQFWLYLISNITELESNFKPEATYKENFKNDRGEFVISTGLTQLSYRSVAGYGYTGLTTNNLKDPYLNLEITAKILKHWLLRDKVLSKYDGSKWIGAGSRYWSTMRNPKVNIIKKNTLEFCK